MRREQRGGIFFSLIFLCGLLCFLAILYVARNPLLRLVGSFWIVDEPVAHADAMIVLSDDNFTGDRAVHAADLYRQGVAPVIVVSNRLLRPAVEVGDMILHDLQQHDVPLSAILKSPAHRASDTREEAYALRPLVLNRRWKRIVIVTSNYHTRRAKFIFERVFPADVTISMAAAPDSDYDPNRWWQMRSGLKMFLYETTGYIVAQWELRNARGVNPGTVFFFHRPSSTAAICHFVTLRIP